MTIEVEIGSHVDQETAVPTMDVRANSNCFQNNSGEAEVP